LIDTTAIALQLEQLDALIKSVETQHEIAKITEEQALQNIDLAGKEFNRVSSLMESGSTNQQRYDQAENGFRQAELAVKQAKAALEASVAGIENARAQYAIALYQYSNCFPTAPMTGLVVDDYVETGELLGPGLAILKIARLDTVEVKVYLPPADLTRIKIGGGAFIDPEDGKETSIEGFISWISSTAEFSPKNVQTKEARANLLFAVKIKIPNPEERLKIGMPVMVTLEEQ